VQALHAKLDRAGTFPLGSRGTGSDAQSNATSLLHGVKSSRGDAACAVAGSPTAATSAAARIVRGLSVPQLSPALVPGAVKGHGQDALARLDLGLNTSLVTVLLRFATTVLCFLPIVTSRWSIALLSVAVTTTRILPALRLRLILIFGRLASPFTTCAMLWSWSVVIVSSCGVRSVATRRARSPDAARLVAKGQPIVLACQRAPRRVVVHRRPQRCPTRCRCSSSRPPCSCGTAGAQPSRRSAASRSSPRRPSP